MERDELAAGFFLIAHDEFSGKLRMCRDRLGFGLVAAELAQLLVAGRLAIADGRVVLTDSYTTEPNEVDGYVLDAVQRHVSVRSVRAWTDSLAEPLYELIATRLQDLGIVRREVGGGLVRRKPDRFPGVDLLAAARPRMRLERMIGSPRELDGRCDAHASATSQKPNSSLDQSTISAPSRDRCVAQVAAADRKSSTK